ncbi:MAG TPA: hypothetical protein VIL74_09155 [Pyrinomonadaceae bacterium]|jgi:hypothetical protein
MQYILFAIISYTSFTMLALFQSPPINGLPDLGGLRDVGLGTAFIGAFFWLIRYFTQYIKDREKIHADQLAAKDDQIKKLTADVLEISRGAIAAQTASNLISQQTLSAVETLNAKI